MLIQRKLVVSMLDVESVVGISCEELEEVEVGEEAENYEILGNFISDVR